MIVEGGSGTVKPTEDRSDDIYKTYEVWREFFVNLVAPITATFEVGYLV
jgi:hypothetical protein